MDGQTLTQPQTLEVKSTENSTILIIEDDPLQVEFLEHGLTRQGYKVLSTATCDGGMRLARNERPDVILLDIMLPDGDGLSLCCRLADDPQTSSIPVIIISGSDRQDIVRRTRSAGGQFFLKKPYDPNALLLLINQSLEDRSINDSR